MAWMPAKYLLRGRLDNRKPGQVTGWMRFAGLALMVLIELDGDFAGRLRGQRIVLAGHGNPEDAGATRIMDAFALYQTGRVIPMASEHMAQEPEGLYLAWSSDQNGQVTLELEPDQLHIVGEPTLLRPRHAAGVDSGAARRVGAGSRVH